MNEIKYPIILLILLVLSVFTYACGVHKDTETSTEQIAAGTNPLVLEGTFQGKNLYVQNPMREIGWCTKYVEVNGVRILDSADVQVSAYEIDLIALGLDTGAAVKVKIYHNPDCMPKVLNPAVH